MIDLKVGQRIFAVDAVGKKKYTMFEGEVLKVPTDRYGFLTVKYKTKNPRPGYGEYDERSYWLSDKHITENDQPWRGTPEAAIRYMGDKKLATLERMKRSMENVNAHINVLNTALAALTPGKE